MPLAALLTLLGPIWIYHVVSSPAIGAMHTPQLPGFMPATPHTGCDKRVFHEKACKNIRNKTTPAEKTGGDGGRINEWGNVAR